MAMQVEYLVPNCSMAHVSLFCDTQVQMSVLPSYKNSARELRWTVGEGGLRKGRLTAP